MIFKAIVIPTPYRIKRYIQRVLQETSSKDSNKEDIDPNLKHINLSKDSFKNYSITMKIF